MIQAIILPLLFISGVFIPLQNIPGWLDPISNFFPVRHYVEAMTHPGTLTAATNYYRALFRRTPMQNKRLLRRIEAPVVVIWGEEDRYLGTELAEPETSGAPNVRVERLPSTSH